MDSPCWSVSHVLFSGIATEPWSGSRTRYLHSDFGWLNPPAPPMQYPVGWAPAPPAPTLFSSCQGWPNVCAPCPQLSQISACLACTHGPTSRPVGWPRGNTSDRQHSRPKRRRRLGTELVTLVRAAGLAGAFLMCQHLCKKHESASKHGSPRRGREVGPAPPSQMLSASLSISPPTTGRGGRGGAGRSLS